MHILISLTIYIYFRVASICPVFVLIKLDVCLILPDIQTVVGGIFKNGIIGGSLDAL